jgi:aryl-alcohol dehydrogenase-like predicted oxidoreductase
MDYRYLGKTGMKVSELCLGAMTFGRETAEEDSYPMLDRFVEAGGNFIDTADVYSQGVSETIVGRWLSGKKRDDLVIATKVRWPMGDSANDLGLSRKHILSAVEASLRRLNTDYIDLYQVHRWDPGTPLEETLDTLDTLVRSGKVRYIGASNFVGWQLQKAIDFSHHMAWEPFIWTVLDTLFEVANAAGKTPAQVALNWVIHRPGVTAPITGARTMRHLEDNLGAAGWQLSPEHMAKLTAAGDTQGPYPYDALGPTDRDRPL